MGNACESGGAGPMALYMACTAATGHRGCPSNPGKVIHWTRSPDWLVLDHLQSTLTPVPSSITFTHSRVKCFSLFHPSLSVPKRLDFLNNPKNMVRQAAHNTQCNLYLKFSFDRNRSNICGVTGCLRFTPVPLTLSIPTNVIFKYHESSQGLGR